MASGTITVEGAGRATADPQRATVELSVAGEGDRASGAYHAAADRSVAVRADLAEHGFDDDRVRTTEFAVDHRSDRFDACEDDPAYRAEETLVVDCLPDEVRDVVLAATGADVGIRGVDFHLRPETESALTSDALAEATERARAKAETVAEAEGVALGDLREVAEETVCGMDSIVEEAIGSGPDRDVEPSPIAVTAGVTATYEIDRDGG